jgi:hypothetical protein
LPGYKGKKALESSLGSLDCPAVTYCTGAVACSAVANCAAGGYYVTSAGTFGAFELAEIPLRATGTLIGLSAAKVTYGTEQAERISVKVTAHGLPGGKVTILSGTKAICVITLKSGQGSCALTARQLAAGSYHLVAGYPGSFGFGASKSTATTLTVVK